MNSVVVLLLVGVVAYASGEVCQCAGFFKHQVDDSHRIHSVANVQLPGCDAKQAKACNDQCNAQYSRLTGNGNLQHITSKGNTVAALSCNLHKGDVTNGVLSAYSKMCTGKWQHVGDALGTVCCKKGKLVNC